RERLFGLRSANRSHRRTNMSSTVSEDILHEHLFKVGIAAAIAPCPELHDAIEAAREDGEDEFSLWRIIKLRALHKIARLHSLMCDATFLASKLKLPIDQTRPMEL